MKTLLLLFALVAVNTPVRAQEVVRPEVAREFGKPFTVRAEFVAKPPTYYDQNVVMEPYALKVISVDGRELKQPVLIEYRLPVEKKQRIQIERPGIVRTFEAYESLYQPALATPWLPAGEQGQAFALVHVLYLRLPEKTE